MTHVSLLSPVGRIMATVAAWFRGSRREDVPISVRITLPDEYIGQSIDTVATLLRRDHKATLLSVNRGGHAFVNPGTDFVLQAGDDAIVVAEGLGTLAPLKLHDINTAPLSASVVPSA